MATNHFRRDRTAHQEYAFEVGAEDAIPVFFARVLAGTENADAGVIYDDVQGAERLRDLLHQAHDVAGLGNVGGHGQHIGDAFAAQ